MKNSQRKKQKTIIGKNSSYSLGNTAINVMLAVVAIAILTSVVIYFLKYQETLQGIRETRRKSDMINIITAVYAHSINESGGRIELINGNFKMIGKSNNGCSIHCGGEVLDSECINLEDALVGTYLVEMPTDPWGGTEEKTLYAIRKTKDQRIEMVACGNGDAGEVMVRK